MNRSPEKCVVCGGAGASDVWNGLAVLCCPTCGLAWRASFDVPADYYVELNAEREALGEEKAAARLRNAEDRLVSIKKFLPANGMCDIGCGDGAFLAALRDAGYRRCWGIEPSRYGYRSALKKNLDVVFGDLSDLENVRQGRTITVLTLFHVIEHLSDPIEALRTIHGAVGPGGIVVIETPDSNAAIQKATAHKNDLVYREHLFYWNEPSIRRALKQAGFTIVAVSRRSFDWKNASIQASLGRLGVLGRQVSRDACPEPPPRPLQQVHADGISPPRHRRIFLREGVRWLLARLVHVLRRDDYLLVVAERL